MSRSRDHVTVCICTYQRPGLLRRILDSLEVQETNGEFSYSIVVADNDREESARPVVAAFTARSPLPVVYCTEHRKNIALARNLALSRAEGDFVAFMDDDEFPGRDWLLQLRRTCVQYEVAGVLGPVKPLFEQEPPRWLREGGFYLRPTHPTGFAMSWAGCRTGNVLFRRSIVMSSEPPFREEFGTGGEDQDFFRRMIERGHRFIWCDEAAVSEIVPPSRWSRRFLFQRALLRGKNSLRHQSGRLRNSLKSLVAVPLYALALPFLLIAGQHHFMRYLIKWADHLGRLLALVGLNPVRERAM